MPPDIRARNGQFVDSDGRVLLLRGVNVAGSSKHPWGYGHYDSIDTDGLFDHAASVSFVNRPFPLDQADEHFGRLRRWGLTFIRFVVTWEAVEHAGPGVYDREYLQYIRDIVTKAEEYGLQIYVDPHQDVWSRWTGGDGAPMWTLECVGFEPRHFEATKAALCLETSGYKASEFPKMTWPTNYFKLACATMFTLFWGGAKYAPKCYVNGVQVQEYLQSHYLDAMTELAKALQGLSNVVGFGSMNEPMTGYIGVKDLSDCFSSHELKAEYAPTPFQGMCLGEGFKETVSVWSNGFNQHVLGRPDKRVTVDPLGKRAWKEGHHCIWRMEEVWKIDSSGQPRLLQPDYFANANFGRDCYLPFADKFCQRMRSILEDPMLFVELPPVEFSSEEFPEVDPQRFPNAVNASHWYDGVTLFLGAWRPYFTVDPKTKRPAFGFSAVQQTHKQQLANIAGFGRDQMHNAPTLIGETGIPFSMNDKRAFSSGDYSAQVAALDNTISCLEHNLLSYTLWCYTPENDNEYGDLWNLEDLSILSKDGEKDVETSGLDDGGRALLAFVRPHATKVAGLPLKSTFELQRGRYELQYVCENGKWGDVTPRASTEVAVPHIHYSHGYNVFVSDGQYQVQSDRDGWDIIRYSHSNDCATHTLVITSKDESMERLYQSKKRNWQFVKVGGFVGFVVILLIAICG